MNLSKQIKKYRDREGFSLDDLVKGDVEMMKNNLQQVKFNKLGQVMVIFMILAVGSMGLTIKYFGNVGIIIPFVLLIIAMTATIKIDMIKKRENIRTYAEIVAFLENKDVNVEMEKRDKK